MKYISLLIIAVLGLTNVHCSKGKSGKTKRYYTNGDPITLVEGTTMSTGSINESNYQEFNGFYLNDAVEFSERSEIQTLEEKLAEQAGKQEAALFATFDENTKFAFEVKVVDGIKKYIYSSKDFSLTWISKNGHLVIESGTSEGTTDSVDLKIQHISVKKDRSAFSVLVYVPKDEEGNKSLVNLNFTKHFQRNKEKSTGDFDFIISKNIKLRWARGEKVTLNVCSPQLKSGINGFRSTMKLWSDHITSTSFSMEYLANPPPFSDLNNQCIYLVDNYFTTGTEAYANMAATYTSAKNDLLDSDIFLFEKELKKVGLSIVEGRGIYEIMRIVTHEIGHFLGMGHPENLLYPAQKTIMSYSEDNNVIKLYPRDVETIKELYK